MRKHVTMTLLDTEQSYVESLRTLMQVGPVPRPENNLSSVGCRRVGLPMRTGTETEGL